MYFIDGKKIAKNLTYMDSVIAVFESESNWLASDVNKLAVQRIANVLIEAIIDVGNTMIDGFIMRDPGSYEDIIDILVDEKAVPTEMDAPLKKLIRLRKNLVLDILDLQDEEVVAVLNETLPTIKAFRGEIESFIKKETGVVTAFIPEEE